MLLHRNGPLIVALSAFCVSCSPKFAEPDTSAIDQALVERVISTLAADDMRGRQAFTDDALRAAYFLADEFRDAGLVALDGAAGHLQRFNVHSTALDNATVTVDEVELSEDRFAIRTDAPSLAWSSGDAAVSWVGPGTNAQQILGNALESGSDALVLFDESQAEAFRAYAAFFAVRFAQ